MIIVVGLGNPGKKYERTRHNAGFMVLEKIVDKKNWREDKKIPGWKCSEKISGRDIEYIKPSTFMNESGTAVAYVKKHHPNAELVVVHDDKDIPLGEIRMQKNRGPAGHNGIKSIIERLGTKNFWRVRVGIAPAKTTPKNKDAATFVLDQFNKRESALLQQGINQAVAEIKNIK